MIDPATIAALASTSLKLLESGLKLAIWDGWTSFPSRDRAQWLSKLLGLSADVLGKAGEVYKHLAPAKARPEHSVQLWAVHVACFGEALGRYWGGNRAMAGGERWFAPAWARERAREVEAATKFALDELARIQAETLPRATWLSEPTASPMYKALWKAFTGAEVTEGVAPLVPRDQPGDILEFERAFKAAFREALARAGNAELRILLSDAHPRGEALRELLVAEMAAWRHQHVFAGVDTSEGIPEMPLEMSYVEPTAEVVLGRKTRTGKVLALIHELLLEHRVLFVSADFGMGKSLTARTLAWKWAAAYCDPQSSQPAIERTFPIHIRCGGGNIRPQNGLDDMIRRALKRGAEAVGVSVKLDDQALSPPSSEQNTVVLLDGLDELVSTSAGTEDLIRELLEHASDGQRFIVFSRPEALPRLDGDHVSPKAPHIRIKPFDDEQIAEWLWAWPRKAPTLERIAALGLRELATVPILLFMLTLTWETYGASDGQVPRVQIYEAFFDVLAAGKYERGGESHPQIRRAAEQARDVLTDAGYLPPAREGEDGRRRAVAAIRWLMDRVAWEALRREFGGEVLARRHVETLLADELKLPESTVEQVRIGLLLSMQGQFSAGSQQFFFGHRSFLEFAAARYWERQLQRLCKAGPRRTDELEEALFGAPLLQQESRIFAFLLEMLGEWSADDQRRLLEWARSTVADATMRGPRGAREVTFYSDQRILIRQAALAIGSHFAVRLDDKVGLGDGGMLLQISTWWLTSKKKACAVEAPGIRLEPGVILAGLWFPHANLFGANLERANLERANLERANLERADLVGANLFGANLVRADLVGANLEGANLFGANLERANLFGANLVRANLEGANLEGANLVRANLEGANLFGANLGGANLEGANLVRANLEGANLFGANLFGANLEGANLERENLERASQDTDLEAMEDPAGGTHA